MHKLQVPGNITHWTRLYCVPRRSSFVPGLLRWVRPDGQLVPSGTGKSGRTVGYEHLCEAMSVEKVPIGRVQDTDRDEVQLSGMLSRQWVDYRSTSTRRGPHTRQASS